MLGFHGSTLPSPSLSLSLSPSKQKSTPLLSPTFLSSPALVSRLRLEPDIDLGGEGARRLLTNLTGTRLAVDLDLTGKFVRRRRNLPRPSSAAECCTAPECPISGNSRASAAAPAAAPVPAATPAPAAASAALAGPIGLVVESQQLRICICEAREARRRHTRRHTCEEPSGAAARLAVRHVRHARSADLGGRRPARRVWLAGGAAELLELLPPCARERPAEQLRQRGPLLSLRSGQSSLELPLLETLHRLELLASPPPLGRPAAAHLLGGISVEEPVMHLAPRAAPLVTRGGHQHLGGRGRGRGDQSRLISHGLARRRLERTEYDRIEGVGDHSEGFGDLSEGVGDLSEGVGAVGRGQDRGLRRLSCSLVHVVHCVRANDVMVRVIVGVMVGVVVRGMVRGMVHRMVGAGAAHVLVLHGAQHELRRVEAAAVVVVGGEVLKEVGEHAPLMRPRLHLRLAHELEHVTQRVLRQPHLV
eukprot:scaffold47685_cov55-Phaeocystis_antarctica.AAC.1